MSTTTQTNTTEMEQPTRTLVIFGATGDLCRRKLIPALHTLWEKGTLPENLNIIGSQKRTRQRQLVE